MEATIVRPAAGSRDGPARAPDPRPLEDKPGLFGTDPPRVVGAAAELVIAARGNEEQIVHLLDHSPIPMLTLAGERRFVDVNRPARLLFRRSLEEMRALQVDDLTPQRQWPSMEEKWSQLLTEGCIAAPYELGFPDGTSLNVLFWGLRDALPGRHLIVFAPAGWPDDELAPMPLEDDAPRLSPRELQVMRLAADGRSGPQIAKQLVLAPATIKTHFTNIYEKLGVTDRAGAVARALRLGLID